MGKCDFCAREDVRRFAITVDGEALRLQPVLCSVHGNAYLLRVGAVLGSLGQARLDDLCAACGAPRHEHAKSPACHGFVPSWQL